MNPMIYSSLGFFVVVVVVVSFYMKVDNFSNVPLIIHHLWCES